MESEIVVTPSAQGWGYVESTHKNFSWGPYPEGMPAAARKDSKPRLIDQQNRVALPPEVLHALGAEAGDYVLFEVDGRTVRLVKVAWTPSR